MAEGELPPLESFYTGSTPKKGVPAKPPLESFFSDTPPAESEQKLRDIRGEETGVDYSQGAPIGTRYNLHRASNPAEEEAYLRGQYGEGNFRKDKAGNWLVQDAGQWKPVYPRGVIESLKNVGAYAGGVAPSLGGAVAGGLGGAAVGGPFAPVTGVLGAAGGAMGGKGLDEAAKYLQGFYNKTPGQLGMELGTEGALAGAFQAAGPLKEAIKQPLYRGTSNILRGYGGITPESQAVTQSLERFGVNPPISSVAPGMKTFEYDRRLRNMLTGDPMAPARIGVMDQRMAEILRGFGIGGDVGGEPAIARAMSQIQDKTTALSGADVGEGIARRLKARETGLLTEEMTNRNEAERLSREAVEATQAIARQPTGNLAQDVAGAYTQAREVFTDNMNRAYHAIDNMTGGREVVDTAPVSHEAMALIETMDPQAVPPIIARLATGEGQMLTFEQAHNLRTTLRQMADVQDLSPIGQRRGNVMHMAGLVDQAIMNTTDQVGQQAAQALRTADRAYADGIVRFTNKAVNGIIQDVRSGRAPDPQEIARILVDKTSTQATQQMWNMLPAELQTRVRTADLRNLLDGASVIGRDGRQTLDPTALVQALTKRGEVNNFVYPQPFLNHLRELATDLLALGGKVDVTSLPPNQIRQHLERALGAQRALQVEANTNPRLALRSDNPELVDAGARYFLSPGNEARTLAGAQMLAGPEWQAVQRFAVQDLLKSAVVPKGLGRTIRGDTLESKLGGYTQAQQEALFGGRLADIKLIARQARAMFPELEDEMGGSLAAASIKGNLPKYSAIRRFAWTWMAGRLADSPQLTRMLAGQIQASPEKARGIMSWMMQSGADLAVNRQGQSPLGEGMPQPSVMPQQQPVPPVLPPPERRTELEPRRYGGIVGGGEVQSDEDTSPQAGQRYAMMDDPRVVRSGGKDQFGNQMAGGGSKGGVAGGTLNYQSAGAVRGGEAPAAPAPGVASAPAPKVQRPSTLVPERGVSRSEYTGPQSLDYQSAGASRGGVPTAAQPSLPEGFTIQTSRLRASFMEPGEGSGRKLVVKDPQGRTAMEVSLQKHGDNAYQVQRIENESMWKAKTTNIPHYRNLSEAAYQEAARVAAAEGKKLYVNASGETSTMARAVHRRMIDKGLALPPNKYGEIEILP